MTKLEQAALQALEAFGEIEWSNNSQWQSDRAKTAITALCEALEAAPHTLWHEGGGPLLDLEIKRQGGSAQKMALYTAPINLACKSVQARLAAQWGYVKDDAQTALREALETLTN